MEEIKAIDLFCGIGGLTNGLGQVDIDVIAGFDYEKSVKHAYEKNNNSKFYLQDITKLDSLIIKNMFKNAKKTLIAGCAPCQPFTSYQKDKKIQSRRKHFKYPAFLHFIRLVKDIMPDFVTMENVRGLTKDQEFDEFVLALRKRNYFVDWKVVNIANYGAPQNRVRLLLVASKGKKIILPVKKTKKIISVKEAIGHLPKLKAGEKNFKDPLHVSSNLSEINLKRIKASKPGGTWKDWPIDLLPNCYKKESGKTFSSVYGRLDPDKPSGTLTTQFSRYGTGRYGHYKQNRALSLREGAIIQTFPESYDFNLKENGVTKVSAHIGNAVPPVVGKIIGETFKRLINEN